MKNVNSIISSNDFKLNQEKTRNYQLQQELISQQKQKQIDIAMAITGGFIFSFCIFLLMFVV